MSVDDIIGISGTNPKKCMKCGKCTASCPPSNDMDIRPHRFVKGVEEGDIEALARSESLWKCLSCFACVERCPRGVKPSSLLEATRLHVLRKQGGVYVKQDDVPAMVLEDDEIPQQLIVSLMRKFGQ